MAGEAIEAVLITLMAFDAGQGVPGPVPCSICGVCGAVVAVQHDGEYRHLVQHEQAGQLGGSDPTD